MTAKSASAGMLVDLPEPRSSLVFAYQEVTDFTGILPLSCRDTCHFHDRNISESLTGEVLDIGVENGGTKVYLGALGEGKGFDRDGRHG